MKKSAPPKKTVLEAILDWSQDRPVWQRDALRRIVSKVRLESGDIQELIEICKHARGMKNIVAKANPLEKAHLPANPGHGSAVSLVSISDVNGVNNLASGQILIFEQNGLTIIYGDNGAGKSGYARILKRTCRARHAGKIEPNVYAQQTPARASAVITYTIGGTPQSAEKWQDGQHPHATLSAVSVFDSDCASVHIKEKNEVAFRPFGLDVPDELANVCQTVRDALIIEQKQLEKARNPIFSKPPWKEFTAVGKILATLKHNIDLQKVEALASLTDEESARLSRLKEDLSKNPAKASAEQFLKADNIKRLLNAIRAVEGRTNDAALSTVAFAVRASGLKREAARLAAGKAFSGEPVKGVGGEVWRALWESARRYSKQIAYPAQTFPPAQEEARCVLCQQLLDAEARDRMVRFEEFIQNDTERQAEEAEQESRTARLDLVSANLSTRPLRTNLQEIGIQNADLARKTRRFFAVARLRRYALLKIVDTAQDITLPNVVPNPANDLAQLEATIRDYAGELQKSATADERKKLERDLAELNDRALLGGMFQAVREEVDRLKAIEFLEQCLADTSTNAITKLGNEIADSVITPRLRDRFQEEIVKLAADKVRVEVVRSGGKYGSPQYQVRLFAKPEAKVQDILSEGEKTCVALAAFLTELATATHYSTLVFDDPVSSLDHRWRKQVAKRLVEESEQRQIVVFTHDLVFVNDLHDLAEQKKRLVRLITISRGHAGAGMVSDGLPWKGKSIEDRIDKLEKVAQAAKKLYDDNREEEYNNEAAVIYNKLRASWERGLEDIAFSRVVQRHRDYIDTKQLKKVTVLSETDCDAFQAGFKKCCDVVDSHDPSGGRNAAAPPPDDLYQDLESLKNWVKELREKQKQITAESTKKAGR